jgi:selenide, water dikinase
MRGLSVPEDGNVIVGLGTSDDAGVYRLSDTVALIQTVDYITPIVDDPYLFGRIAACNSLSDVYAMGGRPLTALNIVCFPLEKFSLDVLGKILAGGLSVLGEAGTQLMGGHSVNDPELKYGLSVTGIVHPGRAVRNDTIRAGDALILTKPLGTGIIATAVKAGGVGAEITGPFVRSMTALNRAASGVMLRHDVHACTDVTGFGLLGHLKEMLGEKGLEIIIYAKSVPVLPGAREAAAGGLIPGGMYRNRDFVNGLCVADASVPLETMDILYDPQTSGGLIMAVAESGAGALLAELKAGGIADAAIIGRVREAPARIITVTGA